MRKFKIFVAVISITIFCASTAFAQETLMQKIRRKFNEWRNKPQQAAQKAAEPAKLAGPAFPKAQPPVKSAPTAAPLPRAPEAPAQPVPTQTKPVSQLSKEELIKSIKETIQHEQDILNFIPELKKRVMPDGQEILTYHGTSIDDLDKEKVQQVSVRVHNEAARIRAERLNRQLENIRQIQQTVQQTQQATRQITQPPKVPTPPQVVQPPQPPKIPAPPPQPPKR